MISNSQEYHHNKFSLVKNLNFLGFLSQSSAIVEIADRPYMLPRHDADTFVSP